MRRKHLKELQPIAYQAMLNLENYGEEILTVSKSIKTLIKIRASQLNKCNYCIDMHIAEAQKINENRVNEISNWRNSKNFNSEEKLALQLTEEITLVNSNIISDELYFNCVTTFGEVVTAQLMMLVVIINAWNRIAITTKMEYIK